jgi:hypothetical protein
MAITGPLGLRALQCKDGEWYSPSHDEFRWESQVAWANCPYCPVDDDGHTIIQRACSCGIHATWWPDELLVYAKTQNHVCFLVEALGSKEHCFEEKSQIWMHEFGFTATGALIVGVVNIARYGMSPVQHIRSERKLSRNALVAMTAARKFNVPILSLKEAHDMIKAMCLKGGNRWPQEIEMEYNAHFVGQR